MLLALLNKRLNKYTFKIINQTLNLPMIAVFHTEDQETTSCKNS